jgi:C_GCAxxG_C_C family probable redox protein
VFSALAERVGVPVETALKIAAPFGGGIGRLGEVCGAVSGGLMAIGAAEGNAVADPAAKDRSYRLAREFAGEFRRRHGAITCRDLLGCDIGTPEGHQQAREAGVFKQRCPRFIQDATEIAAAVLERPEGGGSHA